MNNNWLEIKSHLKRNQRNKLNFLKHNKKKHFITELDILMEQTKMFGYLAFFIFILFLYCLSFTKKIALGSALKM